MNVTVRRGEQRDLVAVTDIYNYYVRSSHATFDTVEFTAEQRQVWLDEHSGDEHVLFVAERDGVVVGYATSGPFRAKPAYASSVETTVYVAPSALGDGLGRALYRTLLDYLVTQPALHRAYAGIAMPHEGSVALHLDCGFKSVGTFTHAGHKFDRYVDVQWFERGLDSPVE